jgi:hypothetical protein
VQITKKKNEKMLVGYSCSRGPHFFDSECLIKTFFQYVNLPPQKKDNNQHEVLHDDGIYTKSAENNHHTKLSKRQITCCSWGENNYRQLKMH